MACILEAAQDSPCLAVAFSGMNSRNQPKEEGNCIRKGIPREDKQEATPSDLAKEDKSVGK